MSDKRVLPSRTEPMAADVVDFLGGAPGKHAAIGSARWWTPLRVLLGLSGFFLVLAFMQKLPCLRPTADSSTIDWSGNRSYTTACYNDVIPLFTSRGLDNLHFPYVYSWMEGGATRYMEYPVLTGLHQYASAVIGRGIHNAWSVFPFGQVPQVTTYWIANCILLSVAWMLTIVAITTLTTNRVWDTVVVAASPLVIVHAFTNWDILSIAACVGGLYFWSRRRPFWAGAFIGLGIAFKLWPLFVFGALGLLCLRAKKWRQMGTMITGTAIAWLAVNVPIFVVAPDGWKEFYRMNSQRAFEGSTIYQVGADIAQLLWGAGSAPFRWFFDTGNLNIVSMLLLLSILGGLVYVVLRGTAGIANPRVAQVAFIAVAGFVISNKVWSPQFSLWLLPLIVLALPRWKLIYTWAAVEAVYWYLRMWQFLPQGQRSPEGIVDVLTLVRIGLIVTMGVLIVRQMVGKDPDPVRDAHDGRDPLACWEDPAVGVESKNHTQNTVRQIKEQRL